MIVRGLVLLVSFTIIIDNVWSKYTTLEEFVTAINSSLIVQLQENNKFLFQAIEDFMGDFKAYVFSNFGYNRIMLAKSAEKILNKIDELPESQRGTQATELCISNNKQIMFFLLKEATLDWYCLETQVFITVGNGITILKHLHRLANVPGSDCSWGILCIFFKGVSGVGLGASISVQLMDFGLSLADFFSAIRRCQKNVNSLDDAFDVSLDNIKNCIEFDSNLDD